MKMSFQERRALVDLASTVLINVAYAMYMAPRYPLGDAYAPELFRFWGIFFLILLPVALVAKIVIYIIFSIANTVATKEDEPAVTDERDKIIELRANSNALHVFGVGAMLAFATLALSLPPAAMFITLLGVGVAAEITHALTQFYSYRRGF
jgi:hypothetical protein